MSSAAPSRPGIASGRRHAGLGTTRLFWAFALLLGLQLLFDLGQQIVVDVRGDPSFGFHLTMWVVVLVADAAIAVVTRVLGNHLPNWLYWMFVAALSLGMLMDLVSQWGQADPAGRLTAGTTAAVSLVLTIPTRSTAEIVGTIAAMTGGMLVALSLAGGWVASVVTDSGRLVVPAADTMLTLCQVLFPVLVPALVMVEFRTMVRREVEQTLSHSTLTAPRLTVGIDQSEQLARLDLAAESLLAAVADGRVKLPLNPEIAKRAGQLATELRLHLLESRSKTWLDLAIAESEILESATAIEDPSSSAGLLNTRQRGALLSALWLLSEPRRGRRRTVGEPVTIEIAPPADARESAALGALRITITVPWANRSGVDPGVWEHVAQVGRYSEANVGHGLAVEIRALVTTGPRPRGRGTKGPSA